MSLQHRLNAMERRIKELEDWKASIHAAIEAEDQAEQDDQHEPIRTLDGQVMGGERDQNQPL